MSDIKSYTQYLGTLPAIDRVQVFLSLGLKLSLVIAFLVALLDAEWMTAFVVVITLLAALLPWLISHNYRFYLPIGFEFVIVLFVYATLFLGEMHGFYTKFWWWDVVLHTGSGTALGFVGFLILYSFYRNKRFQARAAFIAVLSFSVSLAIGVLWEIFEFGMDQVFGLNMQKTGLVDTMWDLIVNTIGAFIAAASGYVYLRYDVRGLGIFQHYLESYFGRRRRRV